MKNYGNIIAYASCALACMGAMMLTGCQDNNYDLGNLDKNIAIGSEAGLALPGDNSTRNIVLDDLLDISSSDVIATDNEGNYVFEKDDEGGVSEANPLVDVITIRQNQKRDFTVNIPGLSIPANFSQLPGLSTDVIVDLATEAVWSQIPAEVNASDTITVFELKTSHDETIVDLEKVETATDGSKSSIDMSLTFSSGLTALVSEIEKIEFDMPVLKYIDVDATCSRGSIATDKANRKLVLSNVPTSGTKINIAVKQLANFENKVPSTSDSYLAFTSDSIFLKGSIKLAASIQKSDLSKAGLKSLLTTLYNTGTTPAYNIAASTTIHDVEIAAAQGKFKPKATVAEGKAAITSIPDFLDDDQVTIKLDNPQLYLDVSSDMNVRAQINDIVISAINTAKNGKPRSVRTVKIGNINLEPCTDEAQGPAMSHIVICDNEHGLEQGYTPVVTNQTTNTLQSLISTIPDSITFTCSATADPTYLSYVKLGKSYSIKPSYRIKAPLTLNTGSRIVYTDSITGWNGDLDEVKLTKDAFVRLTATAKNGTPLDLNVSAKAIDAQGKEISSNLIEVSIVKGTVAGAKKDAAGQLQQQASELEIVITQHSQDAFQQLDGIRYRAEATSKVDGITLNSQTQTLKIENISVSLKGKVIKNLDD